MKKVLTVSVDEGLLALDSVLAVTIAQSAQISTWHSEIEKIVVKEFEAQGTVMHGSYARHTMIQPLEGNIIELFVLQKPERGQLNTPAELMRKLEDALLTKYPDAAIKANGRAVVVSFEQIDFHVTPSFFREDKGYIVANSKKQQWVKTDPSIHYYALDDENHKHKGLLLPAIRIIKYWNECNGSLFNNYYLELLLKETLSGKKVSSNVHAIKTFFKRAIGLVVFTIDDPADFGKQMDGLKDIHKMLEALQHFIDSHAHIIRAEQYEKEGNMMMAYKEFGKIFGGNYPGYVDMMAKKLDANGITGIEALQILRDAT